MTWLRFVAYGLLFAVLVHALATYARVIEPFANPTSNNLEDITKLMTLGSECFCPAIDAILDNMQNQYAGTDEQKRDEARLELMKDAKGPLFPCPVPSDPLATPANIDQRISLSVSFLEEKLIKIKTDAEKKLGECPSDAEGFEDVCSGEEEQKKEDIQRKEAAVQATKSCVSPKGLSQEDKDRIAQLRVASLKQAMEAPLVIQKMAVIKTLTKDVKDLKQKAESGELKSSCPT